MPQRNGYKSHRGRSAVARRVINTNSVNGIMPQQECIVTDKQGNTVRTIKPCGYFGGNKKGGAPPNATGFMIPSSLRHQIATKADNRNYLFKSFTGAGHPPFQVGAPLL